MASVSSLGSGSGLDLEGLVTKLMNAEQAPLTALKAKVTANTTRISSLGSLSSALSSLKTAAAAMKTSAAQTAIEKYASYSATSTTSSVATASATTGAVAGSYSLTDVVLATAQQIRKTGISVPSVAGSLSIQVGTATAVNVTMDANSTLADVASAINEASAGVTASIVTSGSDSYLTLTATNTGAANTITVTGSDTGGGTAWQTALGYSSTTTNNWTQKTAASDASLKIEGLSVTSASNTLTNISGVTVNLLAAGSTTITVSKDTTTSLTGALNAFVTAYNTANTTMNSLGAYNATTKKAGALQGDSYLRTSQSQVRSLLFSTAAGGSSVYQVLSDIGISVDKDGVMSLNTTKLNNAISADFTGVANLVAKVGSAYDTALENIVGTSGTLVKATENTTKQNKLLEDRQTAVSYRLTKIEAQYRAQFTALDTVLTKFKTTSDYLTQQIASLTKSN